MSCQQIITNPFAVMEDASGWQEYFYGKMGEVTKNIRTFALPYETKTYTFAMEYEYDSWNRMRTMTYPDGEVVSYGYNRGGLTTCWPFRPLFWSDHTLQPNTPIGGI